MYLRSSGSGRSDQAGRYWGRATATVDRILLVLGWISLLLGVPALWIWLIYGSRLSGGAIYGGAAALSGLTAGIGFGMIRLLDGKR